MTVAIDKKIYTFDEYLKWQETVDQRYEYHHGEIIEMTGGTTNHNRLALNFAIILNSATDDLQYNTFIADVKLWIASHQIATSPDVMLIVGEPIYYGNHQTTVTNPILIAEVLSKSTRNYDQTDKFFYYRSLPTLTEYILIDQYHVTQFNKTDHGKWLLSDWIGENALLKLATINIEIKISDLYRKVKFDEA
jgi:Uma2 family endonuclease